MSNWAALQQELSGLPIAKRAKHGIHFARPGGLVEASFSGKPCHYLDSKDWKAIDTAPVKLSDGRFGCPHSPLRIASDGTVSIEGAGYSQRARLFSAAGVKLDGDRLVRSFNGGEQSLYITEDGFRSEIRLDRKPNLLQAAFLLASVSGSLPGNYIQQPTVMTDADGKEYTYDTPTNFRNWLEGAKYPVTIDPDFSSGAADKWVRGSNANYATARATSTTDSSTITYAPLGAWYLAGDKYYVDRAFYLFDTSSIGAGSTVTQANLKLVAKENDSTTDFDVQIVKQSWGGLTREQQFDGCLAGDADDAIWRNTSGMNVNTQYASGNLSTAWIVKDGTTYYSIRSSIDYNNTTPAGRADIQLYTSEITTAGYKPVLTVLYTVPSTAFVPILDNLNSIILNGSIVR